MYLLKVITKFEEVIINFDLLTSTYFYIYIMICRHMLKVARMLTNVKGQRLTPDHEKVMTADGKCTFRRSQYFHVFKLKCFEYCI